MNADPPPPKEYNDLTNSDHQQGSSIGHRQRSILEDRSNGSRAPHGGDQVFFLRQRKGVKKKLLAKLLHKSLYKWLVLSALQGDLDNKPSSH